MNKTCAHCKNTTPINNFSNNKNAFDGHQPICKQCDREQAKKYRNTPKGRANKTWHKILQRAENKDGKNPSYSNIKVKMTKEEFIEWATPQYELWFKENPHESPSVNRIDPNGHYEISNLEIISWQKNAKLGLQKAWQNLKKHRNPTSELDFIKSILNTVKKRNFSLRKVTELLLIELSKTQIKNL